MRRGGMLLSLWLVVAFTAVGVGTWALSLVGGKINDSSVEPLSSNQIQNQLSQGGATTGTAPTQPAQAAADPDLPARSLSSAGGAIQVSCDANGLAYIRSWSAAPGYRADDDPVRGPAKTVQLEWKNDNGGRVEVQVHCENGTPVQTHENGGENPPPATAPNASTAPQPSGGQVTNEPGDDHGGRSRHGGDDH